MNGFWQVQGTPWATHPQDFPIAEHAENCASDGATVILLQKRENTLGTLGHSWAYQVIDWQAWAFQSEDDDEHALVILDGAESEPTRMVLQALQDTCAACSEAKHMFTNAKQLGLLDESTPSLVKAAVALNGVIEIRNISAMADIIYDQGEGETPTIGTIVAVAKVKHLLANTGNQLASLLQKMHSNQRFAQHARQSMRICPHAHSSFNKILLGQHRNCLQVTQQYPAICTQLGHVFCFGTVSKHI